MSGEASTNLKVRTNMDAGAASRSHQCLFMEQTDADRMGTGTFPDASFKLYESPSLSLVSLSKLINGDNSYPKYQQRPLDINTVQAEGVTLTLKQLYRVKKWTKHDTIVDIIDKENQRLSSHNVQPLGGFIIGDGTGAGKTREIASVIVNTVLSEKILSDYQRHTGYVSEAFAWNDTGQNGRDPYQQSISKGGKSEKILTSSRRSGKEKPFFIWLTCSTSLYKNCKGGIQEVLTNANYLNSGKGKSWEKYGLQDRCTFQDSYVSFQSKNHCTEKQDIVQINFVCVKDIKKAVGQKMTSVDFANAAKFFTMENTILFLTYASLKANSEFIIRFLTGGAPIEGNTMVPIRNFTTGIICDEFHVCKNISDPFRDVLVGKWIEEDETVLSNMPNRPVNPSVTATVNSFMEPMMKDKRFNKKRGGRNNKTAKMSPTSDFLSRLGLCDTFRLMVELTKYHSFFLMVSATPFQSTEDLHTVDHILRKTLPAYTSIQSYKDSLQKPGSRRQKGYNRRQAEPSAYEEEDGYGPTDADALAETSEYATRFLENVVRTMKNTGQFVSRCISIQNVGCSIVNCDTSPLQRYALDKLSSYFLEAREILLACKHTGEQLADYIGLLSGIDGQIDLQEAKKKVDKLNSSGALGISYHACIISDADRGHDGQTTIDSVIGELLGNDTHRTNENVSLVVTDEEICKNLYDAAIKGVPSSTPVGDDREAYTNPLQLAFAEKIFTKLRLQYYINTMSNSVACCKSALLSVKTHSATKAVMKLRGKDRSTKKVVMSLELTGDSFLSSLQTRLNEALKNSHGDRTGDTNIIGVGPFDSSPVANTLNVGYRLLVRAVVMGSCYRFKTTDGGKDAFVTLVPKLPPVEPLTALHGNPLDMIGQNVGDDKHAEVSNRKLACRGNRTGTMEIVNNKKTANTNDCLDKFNNTTTVDVIILGRKGSTGVSLHDSQANRVSAQRLHFVIELPYNAIVFMQFMGRTNRNGQLSVPHFLIFSTDSPSEKRFYECLNQSVMNTMAGTNADRYSSNSINVTSTSINREQFIDNGLVLKSVGYVFKIILGDLTPFALLEIFSSMMLYSKEFGLCFVEGLDLQNKIFVDVLTLGLMVTTLLLGGNSTTLCEKDEDAADGLCNVRCYSTARRFIEVYDPISLIGVAGCSAKMASSRMCQYILQTKDLSSDQWIVLVAFKRRLSHLQCYDVEEKLYRQLCVMRAKEKREKQREGRELVPFTGMGTVRSMDTVGNFLGSADRYDIDITRDPLLDEQEEQQIAEFEEQLLETVGEFRHKVYKAVTIHHKVDGGIYTVSNPTTNEYSVKNVRILGNGLNNRLIHASSCEESPASDMFDNIPVVCASRCIQEISAENISLIFDIVHRSNPLLHRRRFHGSSSADKPPVFSRGHVSSFHLLQAHRLCKGLVNYRQFLNNLFSPSLLSKLSYSAFISVRSILARDDRLEGLCKARTNSVMGATITKVGLVPSPINILSLIKNGDKKYCKHIAEDIIDTCLVPTAAEPAKKRLKHDGPRSEGGLVLPTERTDHDLDVILSNGDKIKLTCKNSFFVSQHIESFLAANFVGSISKDIMQLCITNNHDERYAGVPGFCLYHPSFSGILST